MQSIFIRFFFLLLSFFCGRQRLQLRNDFHQRAQWIVLHLLCVYGYLIKVYRTGGSHPLLGLSEKRKRVKEAVSKMQTIQILKIYIEIDISIIYILVILTSNQPIFEQKEM